ncbi:MAG: DUF4430 domain-containing protein [Atopobiaceae bacterium]
MDQPTSKLPTQKPSQTPPSPYDEQATTDTERRGSHNTARVVVGVLAALLIAFCAWSMSQYVQGKDPLAIFGSGMQTTQASQTSGDASDSSQDNGTDQAAATSSDSTTITKDDVVAAIGSLTFDGQDVSCPADDVRVVLRQSSGIWVEQVSTDDATTMVQKTAQREAALCNWAYDHGVDAIGVTWIVEDSYGYTRMVVIALPSDMPQSGSTSDLLQHTAYAIDYTDYHALDASISIAQTQGDTPDAPDGTAVQIATTQEAKSAQDQQEQKGVSAQSASSGQTSSGDASATGDDGSKSAGGSGGNATAQPSNNGGNTNKNDVATTVSVTVDGSAAGGSSYTRSVSWSQGMTAYDALVASGANVNSRGTMYGVYVSAIDGLAEFDHGGQSGWVYSVNGSEPGYTAGKYVLSAGDSVVWTYVNVTE